MTTFSSTIYSSTTFSYLKNVIAVCLFTISLLLIPDSARADAYWNVFNIEGETSISASFVTYDSESDMLMDTNRTGVFTPGGFANNIVGSGSDGNSFWNVFNIENESTISASTVTYDTVGDMLNDTNRTGVHTPGGFGSNIVGSGSDGNAFWNVFNIEGESSISASTVTYDSLADMLDDTNRTGIFTPGGFGSNIVGSGSNGLSYWNVFNIEGESTISASTVTYDTLSDMLNDVNRTGVFTPGGFGSNIVGSGGFVSSVPEPGSAGLLFLVAVSVSVLRRRSV